MENLELIHEKKSVRIFLLALKNQAEEIWPLVNHNNKKNCKSLYCSNSFKFLLHQLDCSVLDYNGFDGCGELGFDSGETA